MTTVFVFHSTVGFQATAVIVRVYKKKNDLLTAWQTDTCHTLSLMRDSRKFRRPMGLNVLRCGTDFGDKESFIPKTRTLPVFVHY